VSIIHELTIIKSM